METKLINFKGCLIYAVEVDRWFRVPADWGLREINEAAKVDLLEPDMSTAKLIQGMVTVMQDANPPRGTVSITLNDADLPTKSALSSEPQ